jgi:hypothetical protein
MRIMSAKRYRSSRESGALRDLTAAARAIDHLAAHNVTIWSPNKPVPAVITTPREPKLVSSAPFGL